MEFKKTIAAVAFTATSVFSFPIPPAATKTICLPVYEDGSGVLHAGSCDETRNNKTLGKQILANGCAAEQISVISTKHQGGDFDIKVASCLPPNVVQL